MRLSPANGGASSISAVGGASEVILDDAKDLEDAVCRRRTAVIDADELHQLREAPLNDGCIAGRE